MKKMALMGLVTVGILGAAAPARAQVCATIYKDKNFGGPHEVVLAGSVRNSLPAFDKAISSINVEEGCRLLTWDKVNFEGNMVPFTRAHRSLGERNDKISSLQCVCEGSPRDAGPPDRTGDEPTEAP